MIKVCKMFSWVWKTKISKNWSDRTWSGQISAAWKNFGGNFWSKKNVFFQNFFKNFFIVFYEIHILETYLGMKTNELTFLRLYNSLYFFKKYQYFFGQKFPPKLVQAAEIWPEYIRSLQIFIFLFSWIRRIF